MPPVKDVSFLELMSGRFEDVSPHALWGGVHEREDILELIAESERTARLVKCRPPEEARGHALIEEPAVEHDVHGGTGRSHADGAKQKVPKDGQRLAPPADGTATPDRRCRSRR